MSANIVYQPTAPWIADSNLKSLMTQLGFETERELLTFSQEKPEAFWTEILKRTSLDFSRAPSRLLEAGLPWPKWAQGGEISIVENCVDRHARRNPQQVALIFESDEPGQRAQWTFEDLSRESSFVAQSLMDSGAQPGDRAALLMPMSLEMVASFFGILRAGLTVIPIFSGYGSEAIQARLQDAQVKFVFIQDRTLRRGKEIAVEASLQSILPSCPSVKKVFKWNRQEFLKGHRGQAILPSISRAAESECLLLYTSGTTGKPKACVHTPFGVLATTGKELYLGFDVKSSDRFFWYTDIGWMMGPWELLGVLQLGASVVLYEGVPDYPTATRLYEIMEAHRVTHLGISPTAVRVLKKADENGPDSFAFESLRILGSTGEPWDEETWLWYFRKVGKGRCPVINISGGTEIMGCLLMPSVMQSLKPATLGGPALGVKAQAWSENGEKLSQGLGHLVCLSPLPSMTKGFLNNPDKYLETYFSKFGTSTWYHGDWAFIDEDGFWFLRGRSDDTIKVAGKRVGPNEFESSLMEDPRVAESAAVGIPHEIKGESVYCYVVLKDPSLQSEDLRRDLISRVAKSMGKALAPEKIFFVSALPKTRSGKILRGLIRKIVLKESFDDSAVDQPQSLESIRRAN